jgi:hypothetical protein
VISRSVFGRAGISVAARVAVHQRDLGAAERGDAAGAVDFPAREGQRVLLPLPELCRRPGQRCEDANANFTSGLRHPADAGAHGGR